MAFQNDKEKAEVVQLEYASRQSTHDASASPREKSPADDQGRDHVDVKESLWQATKRYPKVALYGFGLTFGILLYGYDIAVVGNVSSMLPFMSV